MTDSSSFSSLLALVDNHLSKTNIQLSQSGNERSSSGLKIEIPSLFGDQKTTQSETWLSRSPGQRLPIPNFGLGESPIKNVLAEQVANMLKVKELKKQEEEKQRMEEEMKKLKIEEDQNDFVIDLMQAIQKPSVSGPPVCPCPENNLSNSSSFESLFEPKFLDCEQEPVLKTPEPLLPCQTDMSYILNVKIKRARCSPFGKVVCSRLALVASPYLKVKTDTKIKRFDFKTKSPCDLVKAHLRKPSSYNTYSYDLFSMI